MDRFGKVAVLYGGRSAERAISIKSGEAVLAALLKERVDAHHLDLDETICERLQRGSFDRVFNVLHGRGGEDGTLQGLLETLGLPYTGSGPMASALTMDKARTKWLWLGAGIATPSFQLFSERAPMPSADNFSYPLMIKPSLEGSSIGISKVDHAEQFAEAWEMAVACHSEVLLEDYIAGAEYTCAILAGEPLPLIKLETPRTFYDYEAKYFLDSTRYICPCGLPPERERAIQMQALEAFQKTGCSGWGRVDLMLDGQGEPWFIEINTVPGMTDHSLVPMAAREAGLDFAGLAMKILEQTL